MGYLVLDNIKQITLLIKSKISGNKLLYLYPFATTMTKRSCENIMLVQEMLTIFILISKNR
jgi:hypothetical protein